MDIKTKASPYDSKYIFRGEMREYLLTPPTQKNRSIRKKNDNVRFNTIKKIRQPSKDLLPT